MKSILMSLSFMLGCNNTNDNKELLTLKRVNISPTNFKTNGYYYRNFTNPISKDIYVFYNNSVLLDLGSKVFATFQEVEATFTSEKFLTIQLGKLQSLYGLFKIENDNLTIEQWKFDGLKYIVVTSRANIINDTTFQITTISASNGLSDVTSENRIYHFRPYSPKPDSTNSFIP